MLMSLVNEWSEMSSPLTGDSEELMCCGAAVLQCCRDTVVLSSAAVGTPGHLTHLHLLQTFTWIFTMRE